MSLGALTLLGEQWLFNVLTKQHATYYHLSKILFGFDEAEKTYGYAGDYKERAAVLATDPALYQPTYWVNTSSGITGFEPLISNLETTVQASTIPVAYACTKRPGGTDYLPILYRRFSPAIQLSGSAPFVIHFPNYVWGSSPGSLAFRFFAPLNAQNSLISAGILNHFDSILSGSLLESVVTDAAITSKFAGGGAWNLYLVSSSMATSLSMTHAQLTTALADTTKTFASATAAAASFALDTEKGEIYNTTTIDFSSAVTGKYPYAVLILLDPGYTYVSTELRRYISVRCSSLVPTGNYPRIAPGKLRISLRGYSMIGLSPSYVKQYRY